MVASWAKWEPSGHVRLDGLAQGVEHILNLASVGANLVEDVAIGFLGVGRAAVLRRATEAISRRTALHDERAAGPGTVAWDEPRVGGRLRKLCGFYQS